MISCKKLLPFMAALLLLPVPAMAAGKIDSGDTAWMLVSTALVLIMTPGLAFFYAGMVGRKNVVSTLYQSMIALAVVGVIWAIGGYSIAFSTGTPWYGDASYLLLSNVGQEANDGSTIPHLLFMMFQMMFAIITPALITGAFAERVRFSAWVLFMALWSLLIYSPVAHWVWTPTGYLAGMGALDFAGGLVVHMTAGFSALVAAIVFGKRRGFGVTAHKPYDVGYVVLGTTLLWFGWFGFNAGSALTSGGLASQAFANTFLASATAMLAWTLFDKLKDGKFTAMGGCIGVVAGLVAITPAAGFVNITGALVIGLIAGGVCNIAARIMKGAFNLDDTLDVFACHGVGGLLGTILTGMLADPKVNSLGTGLLMAEPGSDLGQKLFVANLTSAVIVAAYCMVGTFILLKIVNVVTPIRVSDEQEAAGLDASQHGEVINQ